MAPVETAVHVKRGRRALGVSSPWGIQRADNSAIRFPECGLDDVQLAEGSSIASSALRRAFRKSWSCWNVGGSVEAPIDVSHAILVLASSLLTVMKTSQSSQRGRPRAFSA